MNNEIKWTEVTAVGSKIVEDIAKWTNTFADKIVSGHR